MNRVMKRQSDKKTKKRRDSQPRGKIDINALREIFR